MIGDLPTYSKANPVSFIRSVALRYFAMSSSFGLGALAAIILLPTAVLFNPLFAIGMFVLTILACIKYIQMAFYKKSWADVNDFFMSSAMPEIVIGLSFGMMCAKLLVVAEIIAPGAVILSAATVFGIVLSSVAYVLFDRLFNGGESIKEANKNVPGYLLTFLIVGLFVAFISTIAGITGVAIMPFITEIFIIGCLSLSLLNDLHSIIANQNVKVLVWDGGAFVWKAREIVVEDNPAYCALLLFSRTVDIFITAINIMILASKLNDKDSNQDRIWEKIINLVITCGVLFGMYHLIQHVFNGTYMRPSQPLKPSAPSCDLYTGRYDGGSQVLSC